MDGSSSDLLGRARRGDRSALSALLLRHVPVLQRWAHGRLPRWARAFGDTADLVQDAVLNTLRRLDQFDAKGERALQGYLRLAVQNRIVDVLRRSEIRTRGGEVTGEEPDRSQPSPLALAITAQEQERYRAALGRLTSEDQTLIVGRLELGYSYEQLALIVGKATPDAARVGLRRSLARLVQEMARG
jgi:RNA polymerase sigma-70 factor (ECF subfamily)